MIILAFAENNMNAKATGEQLYLSDATVAYHLNRIREQMGWNPHNFYDLCYLVGVAIQRMGGTRNE